MGLVKDDFERLHNHTGEAIDYFFRLILSMLIVMFDGLYRVCKRLRESTYTVEAVYVERVWKDAIEPHFRVSADLARSLTAINDIPLGKYSAYDEMLVNRWYEFRGNEMLKEELILSDKPAKGKIKVWKAANQVS